MAIKGGVHYFYSPEDRIVLERIVSDGEELQKPADINFDAKRLLMRIQKRLRWEYVSIDDNFEITYVPSNHKKVEDTENKEYALLIQLVDILGNALRYAIQDELWYDVPYYEILKECVYSDPQRFTNKGSFLTCVKGIYPLVESGAQASKLVVSSPLRVTLEKLRNRWEKNYKALLQSSHYRALSASTVKFDKDSLDFEPYLDF